MSVVEQGGNGVLNATLEARLAQIEAQLLKADRLAVVENVAQRFAAVLPPQSSTPAPTPALVRLDLGCGKNKREGFTGVDVLAFPGVDVQCDLGSARWPWADASVDEAHCSHTVEHLKPAERIHFANELYRVLKPGARATLITPHWASCRAYGDLTHQWPPVSEFWFPYLQRKWREENAPHNDGYTCDFDCMQPGYQPHPELQFRAQDYRDNALKFWKEAAQDMIATLVKRA